MTQKTCLNSTSTDNVTNAASDKCQLSSIAKSAKETLGVDHLDAITDKGFFSFVEIKECVDKASLLMCRSRTGMERVMLRRRAFQRGSSQATNSFMTRIRTRFYVQRVRGLSSPIWNMLTKRRCGFIVLTRASYASSF